MSDDVFVWECEFCLCVSCDAQTSCPGYIPWFCPMWAGTASRRRHVPSGWIHGWLHLICIILFSNLLLRAIYAMPPDKDQIVYDSCLWHLFLWTADDLLCNISAKATEPQATSCTDTGSSDASSQEQSVTCSALKHSCCKSILHRLLDWCPVSTDLCFRAHLAYLEAKHFLEVRRLADQ